MEVQFSQEQEARLSKIANHQGVNTTQLVKDAALRLLNEEEQFRVAVREGVEAADRSEFVSHEDVWAGIEKVLHA
jgi:predicted transcriptional regulator